MIGLLNATEHRLGRYIPAFSFFFIIDSVKYQSAPNNIWTKNVCFFHDVFKKRSFIFNHQSSLFLISYFFIQT